MKVIHFQVFFLTILCAFCSSADNLYVIRNASNAVGKYTTAGATINASLITGLQNPSCVQLDANGNILVSSLLNNNINEYSSSGSLLKSGLVTGLANPRGLCVLGTNVYVANANGHSISRYSYVGTTLVTSNYPFILNFASAYGVVSDGTNLYVSDITLNNVGKYGLDGSTVSANLITGLNTPYGMATDGSSIFVASYSLNRISKYNTSGTLVSTNFITGLNGPYALALDGKGHLFVVNLTGNSVGEYDTATGAAINASLLTGLNSPVFVAVEATAPSLSVKNTAGGVVVSWLTATNYLLQTNSDLKTTNWGYFSNVTTNSGTNLATFPSPLGSLFFRLKSTN